MSYGFDGLFKMAEKEAINQFGDDFNTSTTSNWYKLMAPIILSLSYLEDKFISLKKSRNIYTAQGIELDDICSNDLVFRISGSKATGTATIKGEDNLIIDKGSVQIKGTNELLYTNIESGTIKNGSLDLKFECNDLGSNGNIPENNIKTTVKAPVGVTDVQNIKSAFSGGTDRESDYDYLQRYLLMFRSKDWSLPAIKSAIRQLDGVVSCDGIRNNTMEDGVIPKKSMRLVIDGGNEDEIARTIYLRTHTVNTVGSVEKKIEMVPGQFETIKFDRPKTTTIDYQYTIQASNKDEILNLLKEYLNQNVGVGELISAEEFRKTKLTSSMQVNIKVLDLGFKKHESPTYAPYIQLNFDEKAKAGQGEEKSW